MKKMKALSFPLLLCDSNWEPISAIMGECRIEQCPREGLRIVYAPDGCLEFTPSEVRKLRAFLNGMSRRPASRKT